MDKATPTPSPASADSVMAKAMMLVGALDDSCEEATSLPFLEAVTALRAEVERLVAQSAPLAQQAAEPTYTDDLELRYAEVCEERDHLRAVLADRAAAQVEPVRMLTEREIDDINEMYDTGRSQGAYDCAVAILHKFYDVNRGRVIPADGEVRS